MADKTDAPQATTQGSPATGGSQWQNDFWTFFEPMETCLFAWCLPCVLFGKTSARLKDPSLTNFNYLNGMCCAFYCCHCIVTPLERGKLREKYGIEGSMIMDVAASWICPWCTLVQMEKEATQRGQTAGGYQRTEGMTYQ